MPLKPSYLLLTGVGAIVVYSGLKGKGIGATTREVIAGHNPQQTATLSSVQITSASDASAATAGTGATAPVGPQATGNAKANQAIAYPLALARGWGGNEWQALRDLWNQESGWNQYAYNPSGATGIPQSLPATKMPLGARLASQGGRASALLQILWGLKYIADTYGRPSVAWQHEVANNWY